MSFSENQAKIRAMVAAQKRAAKEAQTQTSPASPQVPANAPKAPPEDSTIDQQLDQDLAKIPSPPPAPQFKPSAMFIELLGYMNYAKQMDLNVPAKDILSLLEKTNALQLDEKHFEEDIVFLEAAEKLAVKLNALQNNTLIDSKLEAEWKQSVNLQAQIDAERKKSKKDD